MTTFREPSVHLLQTWQIELGPYLSPSQVAQSLNVTCNDVFALARRRELLELRDSDSRPVYPLFALVGGGRDIKRIPWLRLILDALGRSCPEPWLWALWLSGWNPKHNGCPPIESAEEHPTRTIELARNEDWSWTSRYF